MKRPREVLTKLFAPPAVARGCRRSSNQRNRAAKLQWIAAALLLVCPGVRAEAPEKIVLIILENTSYADAVAAPFMGGVIAKQGVLLTDYHAISHPSEPNYLALVGGSTFAITDDNNYIVRASSVADLLEAKAKSWHVYAEGYPGPCFLGATSGRYARKHNPLVSFSNIQNDANRCANVTDAKNFVNDFTHRRIADFTMYIPISTTTATTRASSTPTIG